MQKAKRSFGELAVPHKETHVAAVAAPVPGKAVLDPDAMPDDPYRRLGKLTS